MEKKKEESKQSTFHKKKTRTRTETTKIQVKEQIKSLKERKVLKFIRAE